jgi:hypothetical protein
MPQAITAKSAAAPKYRGEIGKGIRGMVAFDDREALDIALDRAIPGSTVCINGSSPNSSIMGMFAGLSGKDILVRPYRPGFDKPGSFLEARKVSRNDVIFFQPNSIRVGAAKIAVEE